MSFSAVPKLERFEVGDLAFWMDAALCRDGVVVAFSERNGGASTGSYDSLNMANHVGDTDAAVDENRTRFLKVLGLSADRSCLTMATMVHGADIAEVTASNLGSGAFANRCAPPVQGVDALWTRLSHAPLVACSADCVSVVLVAPGPVVAVVHAGWKGALLSFPGKAVRTLATAAGCDPLRVRAYLGAHICARCYQVEREIMSQFVNTFGAGVRAESGGLDLAAAVIASLTSAGVDSGNVARLGMCTAEATGRFFSYRASAGVTGRHAALGCIL